ncbi:MAG: GxxExxY protein, partial [Bacteroidales bacterium]|nr:GxxExxY protein [Bacteroidales bacterium]
KNVDLFVEKDVPKAIKYENIQINEAYMIDILVNKNILLAIYVDEEVKNEHVEQALNYMRLAGCNNGLLINFKQKSIDEGIRHLEL